MELRQRGPKVQEASGSRTGETTPDVSQSLSRELLDFLVSQGKQVSKKLDTNSARVDELRRRTNDHGGQRLREESNNGDDRRFRERQGSRGVNAEYGVPAHIFKDSGQSELFLLQQGEQHLLEHGYEENLFTFHPFWGNFEARFVLQL
jgi:hypothetical protein